ncbi:MAG: phosphodiester glycosidase family protein, partial [Oscillospiraceae bacterium]|nr:phosphodiester glycosidase family protein [Oscillospiraceae bacterium]
MENKNSSLLEKDDFDLSDILTPEELAEIERAAEAELGFEPAPVYSAPEEPVQQPIPPSAPDKDAAVTGSAGKVPETPAVKKRPGVLGIIARTLSFVLATVVLILGFALGVVYMMSHGPSDSARDLFVLSLRETSAAGFVTEIFLSDEEISAIVEANREDVDLDSVDTSLITIATKNDEELSPGEVSDIVPLEIVDVQGSTFNGKMMIVADPERVIVGVSNQLGAAGQLLVDMIDSYGGVGGVNAGGFDDPNGTGNGGIPLGIVIHEGKLLYGANTRAATAVIDYDGILHVGNMTGNEAMELNAEWAVSFGPVLVVNGEKCDGLSSGLNPRTAIGQRADGAMLLLVINGRQVGSMG